MGADLSAVVRLSPYQDRRCLEGQLLLVVVLGVTEVANEVADVDWRLYLVALDEGGIIVRVLGIRPFGVGFQILLLAVI